MVSGQLVAIISAAFGMYSLLVSTVVAVQRGLQVAEKHAEEGRGRKTGMADWSPDCDCSTGGCETIMFAISMLCCLGVPAMALCGLYYVLAGGSSVLYYSVTGVGFGLWILILTMAFWGEGTAGCVGFFASGLVVMLFVGVCYYASPYVGDEMYIDGLDIDVQASTMGIFLMATSGGLAFLAVCCGVILS